MEKYNFELTNHCHTCHQDECIRIASILEGDRGEGGIIVIFECTECRVRFKAWYLS